MQEEYEIGVKNKLENKLLFWRRYVEYVQVNSGEIKLGKIDAQTGNFTRFKVNISGVDPNAEITIGVPNEIRSSLNIVKSDDGVKFYNYLYKNKTKIEEQMRLSGSWRWAESKSAIGSTGYFSIKFIRKVPDIFDVSKGEEYFEWLYQASVFFANEFPKYYDEYNNGLTNDNDKNGEPESSATKRDEIVENQPLNQILYGPPGTGKTYETKSIAVKIITGEDIKDRDILNKKYDEFVSEKRIEFVTFHQSYGYEDFVEGIKPKLNKQTEGGVQYEIKKGILRQICDRCNPFGTIKEKEYKDSKAWSIRLADSNGSFDWTEKCFNDEEPRIIVGKNNEGIVKSIKKGDIVVVPAIDTSGEETSRLFYGLGRVIDDEATEYINNWLYRKVEWIWNDVNPNNYKNISDVWSKRLGRNAVYELENIGKEGLLELVNFHNTINSHKNFVLIIDEINRGNISKILGELITLLEDDKRLGNDEELEVTLPYSVDKFSIPNNLYIIGTMNTADRSIAFLDTALRRRFDFREMMPDSKILEGRIIEGVNLQQLLDTINFKIREELDRDHQIGHSYLLKIKDTSDLARAFRNKICPLLDEYFHDRREKINDIFNSSGLITNTDKDSWAWANYKVFKEPANYIKIYEDK